MSGARVGAGAPLAGRLPGLAPSGTGTPGVVQAGPVEALSSQALRHIHYASTWPRGWMAAAVPQQVREFNVQVSKAQLALVFLQSLEQHLSAWMQAATQQRKWPSEAGGQRSAQALRQLQAHWQLRYHATAGSLDERLHWSPTRSARICFGLAGWGLHTLQAQHAGDQELVSFSLLGQEGAHGAWQAQHGRSHAASVHALACALAPLQIQLQAEPGTLRLSVPESHWALVQTRLAVKGNGQRFPAGQWVNAPWRRDERAVALDSWVADAMEDRWVDVERAQAALAAATAQVQQFCVQAQDSVAADDQRLAQVQAFMAAFQASAQTGGFAWVATVVPAVRSISRHRVTRLLQAPSPR